MTEHHVVERAIAMNQAKLLEQMLYNATFAFFTTKEIFSANPPVNRGRSFICKRDEVTHFFQPLGSLSRIRVEVIFLSVFTPASL